MINVIPGQPAAQAGVLDGDEIVGISGRPTQNWEEVRAAVAESAGAIDVEVKRQGARRTIRVTPVDHRIGISPRMRLESEPFSATAIRSLGMPVRLLGNMLLPTGEPVQVSSPSGVMKESTKAGPWGAVMVLCRASIRFLRGRS